MVISICIIGLGLFYTYIGQQMNMIEIPSIYITIYLGVVASYCLLSQIVKWVILKYLKNDYNNNNYKNLNAD